MGAAKRRRDKEYQDFLKSLNNHTFNKIREEIKSRTEVDDFGLIPNTWYVMTTGSRSVAFYKGKGQATIGINPITNVMKSGLHILYSTAWFTNTNMRSSNCIPANIERNILPKMINCAITVGYKPGSIVESTISNSTYQILRDNPFFLVNDILYCKVESIGGYIHEIQLIKNGLWNVKEYRPCY